MRRLICTFVLGFLLLPSLLIAQSDDDDANELYDKQFVYGLNLNTNQGLIGGLNFRYSKLANKRRYHSFSLELVDIKHPKEDRSSSPITGNFYVPGKQNHFYVLRPQFGQELVLFRKAAERGVQVNGIAAIGPTLGIVAPYFVEYNFPNGDIRKEKYDPNVHTSFNDILGTGNLGESLSEAKFRLGGSLKLSLVFEYSSLRNNLIGLETGFMLDVFSEEIVIMSFAENRSVYPSAFLTFFYGIGK